MLKKLLPNLALAVGSLLAPHLVIGQTAPTVHRAAWCGTPEAQERYFAEHPGARAVQAAFEQQLAAMPVAQQRSSSSSATPDITIPVVVHVLHSGGANNITDAQINSGIDLLNTDYQKLNADTAAIAPLFRPIAANVGFRFRLAKIDPNGNCTTGITRHYAPTLLNDDRSGAVQAVASWNTARYLNVWVVDAIGQPSAGGTVLGYSYLPPGAPAGRDGFVVRGDEFGNFGLASPRTAANRTTTHEIGHYLGLSHTWGGGNTPGTGNCTGSDNVADTPTTDGTFSCNLNYAPCSAVANTQNYMDYSVCKAMFTLGQRARMRNVLQLYRSQLISPANLVATGTNDGYPPTPCGPIIVFAPNKTTICEGGSITFRSYSYNINSAGGTVRYAWSFPNGTATPGTASTGTTTVTYPVAGTYSVTLTVTNNIGTDTRTETQLINVLGPALGEIAPLNESFEDPNSPYNYPAPSQHNYSSFYTTPTSTSSNPSWARRTSPYPAADGLAYLIVSNLQLPAGSVATLNTPNISLTPITSPALSFSYYYGARFATSNANLRVQFSTDCGQTWGTATTYSASQLSLTGTNYQNGASPTDPNDWRTMTMPIPVQYHGSGTFKARFLFSNSSTAVGQDNNFFFDKLMITGPLGTHANALAQRGISIYPNPLTHETAVHLTLSASTPVQLRLTDVLGREVLALPTKTYPAGEQAISLAAASNGLPAGVYVVRITLDGQTYTSKLAVQ